MAEQGDLHDALSNLRPIDQSILPEASDQDAIRTFLDSAFVNAAFIVDTIPIPPPPPSPAIPGTRPRSNTASSAASIVSASPARPPPPKPDRAVFQKDWKEIKPGGQNPYDIKVYKLTSKDGNGSWFARRSVHEGIGFNKFRKGLRREFEEGLRIREERGGDGMLIPQGVRGIGAERRVDKLMAKGVGRVDVYHLSAQFPGPSSPRDFVTACLTTASSYPAQTTSVSCTPSGRNGREFTMVSRPITHDGAPEQSGFVRGKYESIEFIREIIPEPEEFAEPRRSMSATDLRAQRPGLLGVPELESVGRKRSRTVGETSRRSVGGVDQLPGGRRVSFSPVVHEEHKHSRLREAISADDLLDEEETTSNRLSVPPPPASADSESVEEEEEDGEMNPVEWIMLTRSDPGGSVPRFMVERGTPGSILKDAEKFLNWATDKEHPDEPSEDEQEDEDLNLDEDEDTDEASSRDKSIRSNRTESMHTGSSEVSTLGPISDDAGNLQRAVSNDDSMSNLSFTTASSGEGEDDPDTPSVSSSQTSGQPTVPTNGHPVLDMDFVGNRPRSSTQSSLALQKIRDDAVKLSERLQANREKDDARIAKELAKEEERQRKLHEKHAREAAKREEKFKREQAKAEARKQKEDEKIQERKRMLEEKDEKTQHSREKEDLKREMDLLKKENILLHDETDALRKEIAAMKLKYEGSGSSESLTPPSRSTSQILAPQRPASSSSSTRSRRSTLMKFGQ